jgi:hypothetical protein
MQEEVSRLQEIQIELMIKIQEIVNDNRSGGETGDAE